MCVGVCMGVERKEHAVTLVTCIAWLQVSHYRTYSMYYFERLFTHTTTVNSAKSFFGLGRVFFSKQDGNFCCQVS